MISRSKFSPSGSASRARMAPAPSGAWPQEAAELRICASVRKAGNRRMEASQQYTAEHLGHASRLPCLVRLPLAQQRRRRRQRAAAGSRKHHLHVARQSLIHLSPGPQAAAPRNRSHRDPSAPFGPPGAPAFRFTAARPFQPPTVTAHPILASRLFADCPASPDRQDTHAALPCAASGRPERRVTEALTS